MAWLRTKWFCHFISKTTNLPARPLDRELKTPVNQMPSLRNTALTSAAQRAAGQRHLTAVWKLRTLGPAPDLRNQNLCFNKALTAFQCTLKSEKLI